MKTWEPNKSDTDKVTNSGGVLLTKAREKFAARFHKNPLHIENPSYHPHDDKGTVGYEYDDCFLCCKDYVYGSIVSCHKKLVASAQATNKRLIMYIVKSDSFYEFDVNKVFETGFDNLRGNSVMINFDIKLGTNIEKQNGKTIL
jgi:hypothetical protein